MPAQEKLALNGSALAGEGNIAKPTAAASKGSINFNIAASRAW